MHTRYNDSASTKLDVLFRRYGIRPDGERRDQDFAAPKPCARINDDIPDDPGVVIEVKILNSSDPTVGGADRESFQVLHAA